MTFKTQFWLDHHWTLGTHETYLYTLPFHFDTLKDFIDFDEIQSSNAKILDSPNTWSHVKSINSSTSSKLSINILKQMKLKMTNLTSITFNLGPMENLCTENDAINQTDIILDSITTVSCRSYNLQITRQWLMKIFPNTKHLILTCDSYSPKPLSNIKVSSQKLHECYHETDGIYLSKIEYAKIQVVLRDLDHFYENIICPVKELVEMCRNLQSFTLHFDHIREFLHTEPLNDLNKLKLIEMFNTENISEKYHIKPVYNYLHFVRKNNG